MLVATCLKCFSCDHLWFWVVTYHAVCQCVTAYLCTFCISCWPLWTWHFQGPGTSWYSWVWIWLDILFSPSLLAWETETEHNLDWGFKKEHHFKVKGELNLLVGFTSASVSKGLHSLVKKDCRRVWSQCFQVLHGIPLIDAALFRANTALVVPRPCERHATGEIVVPSWHLTRLV